MSSMLSAIFAKPAPSRRVSAETCRESLKQQNYGDKTFFYQGQGIGIILDEEVSGHKRVKRILPGSVAAANGQIRVGDRVHEINGQDVWTMDIKGCSRIVSSATKHVTFALSRRPGAGSPGSSSVSSSSRSSISSASPASSAATATPPTKIVEAPKKVPCLIDFSPVSSPVAADSAEDAKRLSLEDELPNMGRQRSDSEASDTRTIDMLADLQVSEDGRIHFSVMLEKGKIEEEEEEFLMHMLYTKGHLSFIRGTATSESKGFYERRWIAIRRGRIIVTKGHNSQITKSIDLSKCTISNIVQSTQGFGPCEYFLGIKRGLGKPTLYFGARDRTHVENLVRAVEKAVGCDAAAMHTSDATSEPTGYCASRYSLPQEVATAVTYRGMK